MDSSNTCACGEAPKFKAVRDALTALDLFRDASPSTLDLLVTSGMVCEHPAGSTFCFHGPRVDVGFIVLSGRMALIKHAPHGGHLIVDLLTHGDWHGLSDGHPRSALPLTACAQVPSKLFCIPRKALQEALGADRATCSRFMSSLQQKLAESQDLASLLAHENVETRLAAVLLKLASRFGIEKRARGCTEVQVTRRELAELIGSSTETVIKICKLWEADGILRLASRGKICIPDASSLGKVCADASRDQTRSSPPPPG